MGFMIGVCLILVSGIVAAYTHHYQTLQEGHVAIWYTDKATHVRFYRWYMFWWEECDISDVDYIIQRRLKFIRDPYRALGSLIYEYPDKFLIHPKCVMTDEMWIEMIEAHHMWMALNRQPSQKVINMYQMLYLL